MANNDRTNTLTWLHISDIHFHCDDEWQGEPVRERLLAFLSKKFGQQPELKPDLIFCTGDIAFGETKGSTLEQQYQHAQQFFDKLLTLCNLEKSRLLVVPGNHDINRADVDKNTQEFLTNWADDSRQQINSVNGMFAGKNITIKTAMLRLDAYQQFIADYLPHQKDLNGRCVYHKNLTVNEVNLGVFGFNSAWSCAGSADDRKLWLGAQWQFNQAEKALDSAQVKLGLIHHPHDWFNEAEREIIPVRSETTFDFMLHGHTHNARVTNSNGLNIIGAGATGAGNDEEFGINITRVDLSNASGVCHLFTFSLKYHAWMSLDVPNFTDEGKWPITLKPALPAPPKVEVIASEPKPTEPKLPKAIPELQPEQKTAQPKSTPKKHSPITINQHKLYGRDALLNKTEQTLKHKTSLLIYGMRGNGKSAFIEALLTRAPLQGVVLSRNKVFSSTTAQTLYQWLAGYLGDKSEACELPAGELPAIKQHLIKLKSNSNNNGLVIWLDNAHLLFRGDKFKDEALKNLIVAIKQVHPQWYWLFELRERPEQGTVPNSEIVAIEGLNRKDLGQLLKDEGPQANNDATNNQSSDSNSSNNKPWHYNANDLKTIFGWLGGGQGNYAHPQATQLLVTVTRELHKTPYEVLKSHINDFEQQLEDVLLADLYHQVLNHNEQGLFATMALYRDYVPVDHVETLEQNLHYPDGFDGLNLRCLITSGGESQYHLHGFFKAWLRAQQSYSLDDEQYCLMPAGQTNNEVIVQARQQAIADIWKSEVKGKKRITALNIRRTNEALFHAIHAGRYDYSEALTAEMLGASSDLVYERLFALARHLFKIDASLQEQIDILNLLIKLKPKEPVLYRFIASTWKQQNGWSHPEVLNNFKTACKLDSSYPQYWANYGKACLAQKNTDLISQFLNEVNDYRQQCLAEQNGDGIDDFVRSVMADCQAFIGDNQGAFINREQMIAQNTTSPVPYVDHAKALMAQQHYQQALDIINKAKQNKAYNEHTSSIEGLILQAMGDGKGAIDLLLSKVNDGVTNPVFYNNLAQLYLQQQQYQQALDIIAKAKQNKAYNEHTSSIEGRILQAMGNDNGAIDLLLEKVNDGVTNPVFYVDLAQLYLQQQQYQQALDIIAKAKQNKAYNEHTSSIEGRILQAMGDDKGAIDLLLDKVNAGATNPAIYVDLAQIYLKQGSYDKALEVIAKAKKVGAANEYTANTEASIRRAMQNCEG